MPYVNDRRQTVMRHGGREKGSLTNRRVEPAPLFEIHNVRGQSLPKLAHTILLTRSRPKDEENPVLAD